MIKISGSESTTRSVGRRKSASARVKINKGAGEIIVNGKDVAAYFPYFEWQEGVRAPLKAVGKEKDFSISVKVNGGGIMGQSVAVRHGIARALVLYNPDWQKTLKSLGFITRDARVKERKKPGLKRARRAPQWSKR